MARPWVWGSPRGAPPDARAVLDPENRRPPPALRSEAGCPLSTALPNQAVLHWGCFHYGAAVNTKHMFRSLALLTNDAGIIKSGRNFQGRVLGPCLSRPLPTPQLPPCTSPPAPLPPGRLPSETDLGEPSSGSTSRFHVLEQGLSASFPLDPGYNGVFLHTHSV